MNLEIDSFQILVGKKMHEVHLYYQNEGEGHKSVVIFYLDDHGGPDPSKSVENALRIIHEQLKVKFND